MHAKFIQVKTSLAFLQTHGVKFGRYWLDIERFAWSSNTTLNTVFIGDMVATLRSQGVTNVRRRVVVMSSKPWK